ncbi:RNase adapter RapZ [Streptomyces sp. NPDC093109]|uniref:RapZ C-terminal domain-containing protein n=1 Tax=Streptomyces sp. NPDC093109 TaxID=3154977 RepID=UPI00344FD427
MIRVTINTFGYDQGAPAEASDIHLDIRRHVLDTHQIPVSETRTGLDPNIATAVLAAAGVAGIVDNTAMLAIGILQDVADARSRLVKISVGDTRGVHWSVGIAEEIANVLRMNGVPTEVFHREITHQD